MSKFMDYVKKATPLSHGLGIAVLMLCQDFVVATLWNWFLVPIGLPTITIIHAIGVDCIISILIPRNSPEGTQFWDRWTGGMVNTLIGLFTGFLMHFFLSIM